MDDKAGRSAAAAAKGPGESFDAHYFANGCGVPYRRDTHWLTFFGGIADQIVSRIHPSRVLDAGCALGVLVEALRVRGVDAYGIDVSSYAIEHVYEPMRPFCRLGSIAEDFTDRFDLIVSIEVLEHMPAADGERAIGNICRHADDVLFSSTPSDHRELTHVNVQPAEYWAEQFARHGFFRDVDFDASFINPWAVRFRRKNEPIARIVRDYERQYAVLASARHDARLYSAELQQSLAEAQARANAAEARTERRGGAEQERAQLQNIINQLGELVVGLDGQRQALLVSRLDLDRERERVAQAAIGDSAALEAERARHTAALAQDRAAFEADRAAFAHEQAVAAQEAGRQSEALHASLEETHAHLTRKVLELDGAQAQAADAGARAQALDHDLRHARETIQLMEQSVFWRARRGWAAISRAIGRRG